MLNAMQTLIPSDLKMNNRSQVFKIFKDGKEHTANEIAMSIHLSRQTVMKAIQHFISEGLIVKTKKGESTNTGGKRPDLFSLNPDKFMLSIQLWPDVVRFTIVNLCSAIIAQQQYEMAFCYNDIQDVREKAKIAYEFVVNNHIDTSLIVGIAVSTPGIIDYKNQVLKYNSLNPIVRTNIAMAEAFREFFNPKTKIILENVAKMTSRVWLSHPEMQEKRILTIFSLWGISGSFISKGSIMNGHNSLIGEIGHMTVDPLSPDECGCGCNGCFEQLLNIKSVRKKIKDKAAQYHDSALNSYDIDSISFRDIFNESEKGDVFAVEMTDHFAFYFSTFLRNITLTFDPDVVIFQGDFAMADTNFRNKLSMYLKRFRYYPENGPFEILYDTRSIVDLDIYGAQTFLLDSII